MLGGKNEDEEGEENDFLSEKYLIQPIYFLPGVPRKQRALNKHPVT